MSFKQEETYLQTPHHLHLQCLWQQFTNKFLQKSHGILNMWYDV
jgi:hypothetical protein